MNPLDQLRDIHLPSSVQWWPLAIGWWLLAGLVLALVFAFWWHRKKNKNQRLMVNHSLEALVQLERNETLDSEKWLQALSTLIRRIVINLHGRKAAAGLVGDQWLNYLDQHAKTNDFSEGAGKVLAAQPYQQSTSYDRKALSGLVQKWVKAQAQQTGSPEQSSSPKSPEARNA